MGDCTGGSCGAGDQPAIPPGSPSQRHDPVGGGELDPSERPTGHDGGTKEQGRYGGRLHPHAEYIHSQYANTAVAQCRGVVSVSVEAMVVQSLPAPQPDEAVVVWQKLTSPRSKAHRPAMLLSLDVFDGLTVG